MTDVSERLAGRVAIISGAAGGQGAAEARLLVAQGAKVMIGDIDDANGKVLADELGEAARYHHLDVRSEDDWQATLDAAVSAFGTVNALVNNAGIVTTPKSIIKTPVDAYRNVLDVNLVGAYTGIH